MRHCFVLGKAGVLDERPCGAYVLGYCDRAGCAATYDDSETSLSCERAVIIEEVTIVFEGLCADKANTDLDQWESDVVSMLVH